MQWEQYWAEQDMESDLMKRMIEYIESTPWDEFMESKVYLEQKQQQKCQICEKNDIEIWHDKGQYCCECWQQITNSV